MILKALHDAKWGLGSDNTITIMFSSQRVLKAIGGCIASSILKQYEIVQLLLQFVLILMRHSMPLTTKTRIINYNKNHHRHYYRVHICIMERETAIR